MLFDTHKIFHTYILIIESEVCPGKYLLEVFHCMKDRGQTFFRTDQANKVIMIFITWLLFQICKKEQTREMLARNRGIISVLGHAGSCWVHLCPESIAATKTPNSTKFRCFRGFCCFCCFSGGGSDILISKIFEDFVVFIVFEAGVLIFSIA